MRSQTMASGDSPFAKENLTKIFKYGKKKISRKGRVSLMEAL